MKKLLNVLKKQLNVGSSKDKKEQYIGFVTAENGMVFTVTVRAYNLGEAVDKLTNDLADKCKLKDVQRYDFES